MSRSNYRILIDGHTHEGVERKKDDIVSANDRIADRYPNVFKRVVDGVGESAPAATVSTPQE